MELKLRIKKPMDSNDHYETLLSGKILRHANFRAGYDNQNSVLIRPSTTDHHDVLHHAISSWYKEVIGKRKRQNRHYRKGLPSTYTGTLTIGGCPIFITKKSGRISLNGTSLSLERAADSLARLTFRSCFIKDIEDLMKFFYSTLSMPENISYVLENRLPYFFYADYERHEVRLNVQRTGNEVCAIEISDGLWGEISFKELNKYCNFYVNGKKRGKWPYTSPANLFSSLVGRKPNNAELDLMVAFLQQNRKQDIVEERALSLIKDMVDQYPERLFPVWKDNELESLYVRGKGYDWKLTNRGYKTGTQLVSTYLWEKTTETVDDEVVITDHWAGPICIDNMSKNSSLGDQFAARAMALLNDVLTIKIVSTIRSYIKSDENTNRIDINDMRRMQGE